MGLLPSALRTARFASLADANPSAPRVPVKRLVLGILLRARYAPRADKIPAILLRTLDLSASPARFGCCIGCDHAAHNRKETPCPTTINPFRRSTSIRSRRQSGGTKRRRAFATLSRSKRATRTARENGSPRRASARVICCSWRRPQIWLTTKFKTTIVATSTPPHTSEKLPSRSGQGALTGALPFFYVAHYDPQRISAYAEQGVPDLAFFSFLLPTSNLKCCAQCARHCIVHAYCIRIIPRAKCGKNLAMRLILRFIRRMIHADRTGSKLCACATRHATRKMLSAFSVAQLGKGQGFALPVASPPLFRRRLAETLPVSTPSGPRVAAVFRSWAVCP